MFGFERITFDPNILGGKACIRGMRISASLIVNLVANGMRAEEIIVEYPDLEPGDIERVRFKIGAKLPFLLADPVSGSAKARVAPGTGALSFFCPQNEMHPIEQALRYAAWTSAC